MITNDTDGALVSFACIRILVSRFCEAKNAKNRKTPNQEPKLSKEKNTVTK